MMAEEPPNSWELNRVVTQIRADLRDGFTGINSRFDEMAKSTVPIGTYNETIKRLDGRIDGLVQDVVDERAARKEAITSLNAAMEKTATWLRWIGTGLLVPIIVPIVLYMLQR